MEVGGQSYVPATLTPGKIQEAGWAQSPSGRVRKVSPLTGIRSPDRPARSESLYLLSYPSANTEIEGNVHCFVHYDFFPP